MKKHILKRVSGMTLLTAIVLFSVAPPAQAFKLASTDPIRKWGDPVWGTGATVTWSFMSPGTTCAGTYEPGGTCDAMPTGWFEEVVAAFDAWSAIANITFEKIVDNGEPFNTPNGTSGDIRLGLHNFSGTCDSPESFCDSSGNILAHGYFPPPNGYTAAGDIHLDSSEIWKVGLEGDGYSLFQVLTHEIGHAIGLHHSDDETALLYKHYYDDSESLRGPQADDIAGAQYIYGKREVPEPPVVPEPGTLWLLGIGLLVAGILKRKLTI